MRNTSTDLYLEAFQQFDGGKGKNVKSKEKFKDLKDAPGEDNKAPFVPKSGPAEADGYKDEKVDPANGDTSHYVPQDFSQGDKKTVKESLNNSRAKNIMEKNISTPAKSEFDRLCEEVLGPEEVELGIDEVKGDEGAAAPGGDEALAGEECPNCTPADRIRNIITELEGILAELEGTTPEEGLGIEGETGLEGEEGAGSLESPEAQAVKEATEMKEIGTPVTGNMKQGKPTPVKGRGNVVEGDASKTTKGPGNGKIEGNHTGNTETQADGKAGLQSKNPKVKGKITGSNQPLFK